MTEPDPNATALAAHYARTAAQARTTPDVAATATVDEHTVGLSAAARAQGTADSLSGAARVSVDYPFPLGAVVPPKPVAAPTTPQAAPPGVRPVPR